MKFLLFTKILKNKKIFSIISGLLAVLLFSGAVFAVYENHTANSTQNQQIETPIVIEIFTPHVLIKLPDQKDFEEITSSQKIPVGTTIKTDAEGRAQAVYPNHSVTRVDHNSEFIIEGFNKEPFQAQVKLSKGKIWSRVAHLLGQQSYETKSENLVASIRGTSFGHNVMENNQDTIIVAEGTVNGDCIKVEQNSDVAKDQKASYPCQQGGNVNERQMTDQDKEDEWYLFNMLQDQKLNDMYGLETYTGVLGTTSSPTSTPKATTKAATPKPTPSPTNNSTSSTTTTTTTTTSLGTPKPTAKAATPKPTPTPSPSTSISYPQNNNLR